MNRFVDPLWVEDEADGEEDVHLVRLLVDQVVLVRLGLGDVLFLKKQTVETDYDIMIPFNGRKKR